MGRRVILHIGAPKTGTTAIIDFLRNNEKQLKKGGFVFPQSRRVRFYGSPDDIVFAGDEWLKLKAALDRDTHDVVACDESLLFRLYNRPERVRQIREFLGDCEFRIVLYLRRQDLFYESLYRETIRGVACPTLRFGLDEMIREAGENYFDYIRIVEFFEQEFGRDSVLVRPFWKERFVEGDLFPDFCAPIGLAWDETFRVPGRGTNLGADARLTDLLLGCNRELPGGRGVTRELKELLEELGRAYFPVQENRLLTAVDRAALLERFAEGNAVLAQRNGGTFFPPLEEDSQPAEMEREDLHRLITLLNQGWLHGMGAVPLWIINSKKAGSVRLKMLQAAPGRRILLGLQLTLHRLAAILFWIFSGCRCRGHVIDAIALRHVVKHLRMLRGRGTPVDMGRDAARDRKPNGYEYELNRIYSRTGRHSRRTGCHGSFRRRDASRRGLCPARRGGSGLRCRAAARLLRGQWGERVHGQPFFHRPGQDERGADRGLHRPRPDHCDGQ